MLSPLLMQHLYAYALPESLKAKYIYKRWRKANKGCRFISAHDNFKTTGRRCKIEVSYAKRCANGPTTINRGKLGMPNTNGLNAAIFTKTLFWSSRRYLESRSREASPYDSFWYLEWEELMRMGWKTGVNSEQNVCLCGIWLKRGESFQPVKNILKSNNHPITQNTSCRKSLNALLVIFQT